MYRKKYKACLKWFFNLSLIDILGKVIICYEDIVLCIVKYKAEPLAYTFWMSFAFTKRNRYDESERRREIDGEEEKRININYKIKSIDSNRRKKNKNERGT